jgi:hypothetical protein
MIANSTPVYLDPKTGRVYGTPTPAVADQATAATSNQVPNSLLDGVPLAAQQGDTSTSKESGSTTGSDAAAADAGKTAGASASAGASSTADVESDPNQLQAPSTR